MKGKHFNYTLPSMILTAFIPIIATSAFTIDGGRIRSTRTKARLSVSSFSSTHPKLKHLDDYDVEVLSSDPLVYCVNNVLSKEECQNYINRINNEKEITRSNAPEVSLDKNKLWPLPFLCIGASIPQIIHLYQQSSSPSLQDIVSVALPPILIASLFASILAYTVTQLIRLRSDSSSRTSDALALNLESDFEFIQTLVSKIEGITNHEWNKFEAPVVTRYQPGALFGECLIVLLDLDPHSNTMKKLRITMHRQHVDPSGQI